MQVGDHRAGRGSRDGAVVIARNPWALALMGAVAILSSGCEQSAPVVDRGVDQCLRREIFKECLQIVPAGPQSTVTNDWSEVIDECQSAAYYQALRRQEQIKPECKA